MPTIFDYVLMVENSSKTITLPFYYLSYISNVRLSFDKQLVCPLNLEKSEFCTCKLPGASYFALQTINTNILQLTYSNFQKLTVYTLKLLKRVILDTIMEYANVAQTFWKKLGSTITSIPFNESQKILAQNMKKTRRETLL